MTILEIVLVSVIGLAVAVALGVLLFKVDTRAEQFKRSLMVISAHLRGVGLVKVPDLLDCFVVNDLSGAVELGKELVKLFAKGDVAVMAEFDNVFEQVLKAKLTTDSGRAYVAAKLADAAKVTDPSVVTDAPQAGVI